MRHTSSNPRRTWWRQLGQLYSVAFAVTLVPYLGAWYVTGSAEREARERREAALASAELALVQGVLDQAMFETEEVLYSEPGSERAKAIRANALFESYWLTRSEYELSEFQELLVELEGVDLAGAHTARGNLALAEEDPAAAREHLERAVAADPDDAYAQHQLGFALNQLGRQEEALTRFRTALALQPDMAWVQQNLHALLISMERCDEPVPGLDPAVGASCNNAVGVARFNAGATQEALARFERAVAAAPDSAGYHANLASAEYRLGRFTAAREHARRAFDLGLRDHWILTTLDGW